jgi:hypothetical protein
LKFNGDFLVIVPSLELEDEDEEELSFLKSETTRNLSISLVGKILGEITLKLSTKALVAAFGRVFPK